MLSIITNIGYDHQQFLGDTLEKIAAEKAGIIKHKTPVIISQKQEEMTEVFKRIAEENEAEIIFASDNYEATPTLFNDSISEKGFDISTITHHEIIKAKEFNYLYTDLTLDLKGIYQKHNIVGVICALEKLKTISSNRKKGYFTFTTSDLMDGLQYASKKTGLKGRWYSLNDPNQKPIIICDIAHNEDGIKQIISQIKSELEKNEYNNGTLRIVFGVANDKDISKILDLLKTELQEKIKQEVIFYFSKPDVPRGLDALILKEKAGEFNLKGNSYESVQNALETAKKEAKENDFIYVGGSAFVVADVV